MHLARLLRLDEFTAVAVPTPDQEHARDLVRAREDARGDLMRARHRLSKLLLRQGIVYSDGDAWTKVHDVWLRQQRFASPALQAAFDSDYDAVLTVKARRDRLDAAIAEMAANSEFTPLVRRLGCLRGVSDLTALGLAVEIGGLAPLHRQHHRRLPRARPLRVLLRRLKSSGLDHQDRQHPCPPASG